MADTDELPTYSATELRNATFERTLPQGSASVASLYTFSPGDWTYAPDPSPFMAPYKATFRVQLEGVAPDRYVVIGIYRAEEGELRRLTEALEEGARKDLSLTIAVEEPEEVRILFAAATDDPDATLRIRHALVAEPGAPFPSVKVERPFTLETAGTLIARAYFWSSPATGGGSETYGDGIVLEDTRAPTPQGVGGPGTLRLTVDHWVAQESLIFHHVSYSTVSGSGTWRYAHHRDGETDTASGRYVGSGTSPVDGLLPWHDYRGVVLDRSRMVLEVESALDLAPTLVLSKIAIPLPITKLGLTLTPWGASEDGLIPGDVP